MAVKIELYYCIVLVFFMWTGNSTGGQSLCKQKGQGERENMSWEFQAGGGRRWRRRKLCYI